MKDERYTLDLVDVEGINEKGMELLQMLNTSRFHAPRPPKDSILLRGKICDCDDDYLCKHRLQVIADWLKENQHG